MPPSPGVSPFEQFIKLCGDAELSLGFAHGTGLGAILLALISLAFILTRKISFRGLVRYATTGLLGKIREPDDNRRVQAKGLREKR